MSTFKEKEHIKNKGPSVGTNFKKSAENIPKSSKTSQEKSASSYKQTLADAEMDLKYAQYIQMAFFESEAKKTLELRSHYVMETFRKLCYLIVKYIVTVKSQTFSLQVRSILIKIYEHIQKQEDILKPLIKIIPTLAEKYKKLAEAVSVMNDKLYIKHIEVPEPGHEGDVFDVLQEMQAFIAEFFKEGPQYKKVISTVDAFNNYVDSCRLITDALKRGLDLVIEARSLYITEASHVLLNHLMSNNCLN